MSHTMPHPRTSSSPRPFGAIVSLALCVLCLGVGCVPEDDAPVQSETTQVRTQPVVVVPTFTIAGAEALPEALYITKLGFTISEIRLEPLTSSSSGLAYSAIDAQHIEFDVSQGVHTNHGEPILLPKSGRYLVSLRLEPVERYDDATGSSLLSSFVMSGFVNRDSKAKMMDVDPGDISEEPRPDPFDGPDGNGEGGDEPAPPDSSETWTPFVYHNERSVFMTLNEVEFTQGEQHLTFNFNLDKWAVEIADPIVRAVRGISGPATNMGVDISRQLDSSGRGSESLMSRGTATTIPR